MDILKLTELSEKYFYNKITEQEKLELNNALDSSSELKKHFDDNLELFKSLDYLKVKNLTTKITNDTTNNNSKLISNYTVKYLIKYTSVAAVSIIAVLTTLYLSGWFTYKNHLKSYTKLGNNISTLTNNQKSLWDAMFSNDKSESNYITGTGFAISTNGYIITSLHVIKGFDSIFVSNFNDTLIRYKADLVYKNDVTDLAIIKISDSTFTKFDKIPYVLSKSEINLAEYVYTLGFSKQNFVFGEGSISSYTGFNEDSITMQVSIPSNPGNSGGPILNTKGEIVGMLCAKNNEQDGATYAVKTEFLYNVIDSLNNHLSTEKLILPKYNSIAHFDRPNQVKKIQDLIFKVETY